jgi:uncharacterized membrane protein HdeD (DUF308 family)
MASEAVAAADMQVAKDHWWVPLVQGIAAIILGLLFLTNPGATMVVTAGLIGFYWLVTGVINIVLIFTDSSMWGWKLFIGGLGVVAGLIVVTSMFDHPIATTLGLAAIFVFVLGLQGVIIGVIEIVQAFQGAGWGRGVLGVLSILIGGFLMFNSFLAAFSIPLVLGILMIIFGIAAIFMAFQVKNA